MKKILIMPDVHGRDFWIEPVKKVINSEDYFIVFLGDYLSCYPYEWEPGIDYNQIAIERFEEVLKFKNDNPDKVVLLMGNHDFGCFNSNICECRTDWKNWDKINKMFFDNIKSFDLAWETKIGDKRYFFSHAGVKKGWFENWVKDNLFKWDRDELPSADYFNNLFHTAYDDGRSFDTKFTHDFETAIGIYSTYRGWYGRDYGSIVWADIREYGMGPEYDNVVFICGHTQLEEEPIIEKWVMDLDVRRPFVLDTETGKVEEYK